MQVFSKMIEGGSFPELALDIPFIGRVSINQGTIDDFKLMAPNHYSGGELIQKPWISLLPIGLDSNLLPNGTKEDPWTEYDVSPTGVDLVKKHVWQCAYGFCAGNENENSLWCSVCGFDLCEKCVQENSIGKSRKVCYICGSVDKLELWLGPAI